MSGLAVIVVTYNSAAEVERSLPPLAAQLRPGDELIVVDNGSADGTPGRARGLAPEAVVFDWGANLGFAAACNAGAVAARAELLVFLNPDAEVQPGWRDAIELPLTEERGWSAWQALVTAEGGGVINTAGGVVHFTGIAWAGSAGAPVAEAPTEPREVSFASGACLAVPATVWDRLGGFPEDYFLYHEDTDLSLRLWRTGHRVGIEPRAVVDHDYDFDKGSAKWFYLERNRWATILRCWPRGLLVALLPALIATELALVPVALIGGWLPEKLRAWAAVIRWLPRLLRERARIAEQAGPGSGAALASRLTPELDSAFLGPAGRSRILGAILRGYWSLARRAAR